MAEFDSASGSVKVEEVLTNVPLYEQIQVGEKGSKAVRAILTFSGSVDTYCPGCEQNATFRAVVDEKTLELKRYEKLGSPISPGGSGRFVTAVDAWSREAFEKNLFCTRNGHVIRYYFLHQDKVIVKIGQHPSNADLQKSDMEKYAKILGKSRLKEVNRGIGLAAHGVGIGSYVYLRRIFESLVEEAHVRAMKLAGWDEGQYQKSRMKEKVEMLKSHLPQFLTENPNLYSILSIGIHELTEDECLKNFGALKLGIQIILEEKFQLAEKEKQVASAKAALAAIAPSPK